MKKLSVIIGFLVASIVCAENNRPYDLSLSNFQFGPVNRWSFSHIREVLPTVNIEHNNEGVSKLLKSKAYIKNFSIDHEDRLQEIDEIAKNWQDRSYLYGTPEDVVKTLSMWQEVGIEAVYLQLLDLEQSKRDESVEVIQKAINLL